MVGKKILGAVAVAAALAGAWSAAQAQPKATVRYQEYPGSIIHLVNWAMKERGFCERQALDCQTVSLASGPLAQQAAAAGSVDLIVSSADVMMQAVAKGNDLQILGTMLTNNIYSLSVGSHVARPNAAAGYPGNMRDLADKRIGVSARGSATEMYVKALFAGAGVPSDKVAFVAVGSPATAFAALAAKQVDAILSWDPVPALCEATKTCSVAVDMRKGEGPAEVTAMNGGFVVWQARREYVEKNAPVIDRFLKAQAEAIAWIKDPKNFPEAVELAKKNFKLGDVPDRDHTIELIVRESIGQYGTQFDPKVVDGFNKFLLASKLIDQPVPTAKLVYQKAP